MQDFFTFVGSFIEQVGSFLSSFFENLALFFELTITGTATITQLSLYLPALLSVGITSTLTVALVKLILGR